MAEAFTVRGLKVTQHSVHRPFIKGADDHTGKDAGTARPQQVTLGRYRV
jgi:hypothetical protein